MAIKLGNKPPSPIELDNMEKLRSKFSKNKKPRKLQFQQKYSSGKITIKADKLS